MREWEIPGFILHFTPCPVLPLALEADQETKVNSLITILLMSRLSVQTLATRDETITELVL